MKLRADRHGTFPPGLHWTPGEVREVDGVSEDDLPYWLHQVKPPAPKKKGKAKPKEE